MESSKIKPFKESGEHSYHRRAFGHNYYAPFIYHLILKKTPDCENFGTLDGDARISPGNHGCAIIRESELGEIIAKSILHLPYEFPILKLYQFCVMPDHLHILLEIRYKSDQHLEYYIDNFKMRVADKYSEKIGKTITAKEIFEPGFCDKPLYDNRSLDGLYSYIRTNPHRLAMRRQYPQFFQRIRKLKIGEEEFEAYGNLFLLRNPDKEAVKISSKASLEERQESRLQWLDAVTRGTILVSPFISREEKAIRAEAESTGARIILITHEAFPQLFKPSAHDFDLCSEGRLLIISLGLQSGTALSRKHCIRMNDLAKILTSPNPTAISATKTF